VLHSLCHAHYSCHGLCHPSLQPQIVSKA
jgi:hypothetical protein